MRVLRAVRATPLRGARFVALEGARLSALRRAPLVFCRAATALADDLVARTFATDATPAAASTAPAVATPATAGEEADSDSDEPTTPAMTKAEVSDAEIIFNTAWKNIESVRGACGCACSGGAGFHAVWTTPTWRTLGVEGVWRGMEGRRVEWVEFGVHRMVCPVSRRVSRCLSGGIDWAQAGTR